MGRAAGWVLGLGVVAVALVAGTALALRAGMLDGTDGDGPATVGTVPPMEAPEGEVAVVPADAISVTASSQLAPAGAITYDPANTIDADLDTAWNSDAPDSQGRGETLTYRFAEPVDLRLVRFVNGYAKNPEIFASNHRIADVMVRTDATSQLVSLVDTAQEQQIEFDFGYTSKVVLEVVEIHPGAGFDSPELSADLALTEIEFWAVQRR